MLVTYLLLDDSNVAKKEPSQKVGEQNKQYHHSVEEEEQIELEGGQVHEGAERGLVLADSHSHDPDGHDEADGGVYFEKMVANHVLVIQTRNLSD